MTDPSISPEALPPHLALPMSPISSPRRITPERITRLVRTLARDNSYDFSSPRSTRSLSPKTTTPSFRAKKDQSVSEAQKRCAARIKHVKKREEEQKRVSDQQSQLQHNEKKRRRRLEELKALVLLREAEDKALVRKKGEQISKERKALKVMEDEYKTWRRVQTESLVRLKEQCETLAVKLSEALGRERRARVEKLKHLEDYQKPLETAFMEYHDIDVDYLTNSVDHKQAILGNVLLNICNLELEVEEIRSGLRELFEEQSATSDLVRTVFERLQSNMNEIVEQRLLREMILKQYQSEIDCLKDSLSSTIEKLSEMIEGSESSWPRQKYFDLEIQHVSQTISSLKFDLIQQSTTLKGLERQSAKVKDQFSTQSAQKEAIESQIFEKLKLAREHEVRLSELEKTYGIEVRMAAKDSRNKYEQEISEHRISSQRSRVSKLKEKQTELKRNLRNATLAVKEFELEVKQKEDEFSNKVASFETDITKISLFVDRKQKSLEDHDDVTNDSFLIDHVISELVDTCHVLEDSLQTEIEQAAKYEAQKDGLFTDIFGLEESINHFLIDGSKFNEILELCCEMNNNNDVCNSPSKSHSNSTPINQFLKNSHDISDLLDQVTVYKKRKEELEEVTNMSQVHKSNAEIVRKKLVLADRKKEVLQNYVSEDQESPLISKSRLQLIVDLTDVSCMRDEKVRLLNELKINHSEWLQMSKIRQEELNHDLIKATSTLELLESELTDEELILATEIETEAQKDHERTAEMTLLSQEFSQSVEKELEKFVLDNSEMFSKLRRQYGDGVAVHMIKDYCLVQKQRHLVEVEQRMDKFKQIQRTRDEILTVVEEKEHELLTLRNILSEISVKLNDYQAKISTQKSAISRIENEIAQKECDLSNLKSESEESKTSWREEILMYYEDLNNWNTELKIRIKEKEQQLIEAQNEHVETLTGEDVVLTKLESDVEGLLATKTSVVQEHEEKEQNLRQEWLKKTELLNIEAQKARDLIDNWDQSKTMINELLLRPIPHEVSSSINDHVTAEKRCVSLYCSWMKNVDQLIAITHYLNEKLPSIQSILEETWQDLSGKTMQLKAEAQAKRQALTEQAERLRLEILAEAENFATNPLLGASFASSPRKTPKETVSYSDLLRDLPSTMELGLPDLVPVRRDVDFSDFAVVAGPLKVPDDVCRRGDVLLAEKKDSFELPSWALNLPTFVSL
ncbi:hypothetical protein RCL1_005982 [Eukaryota sp. TZLM3-RCL]